MLKMSKALFFQKSISFALLILVLGLSSKAIGSSGNVFGPQKFKAKNSPQTESFNVQSLAPTYALKVQNGKKAKIKDCDGLPFFARIHCQFSNFMSVLKALKTRVRDAEIELNGQIVVQNGDLGLFVGEFEVPVNLNNQNSITVTTEGPRKSFVKVKIFEGGEPVNLPPTPVIVVDAPTGLNPHSINLDASQSTDDLDTIGDLDFTWTFLNDGSTQSGTTAQFTYDDPGTYSVELTVTDSGGLSASTTTEIEVIQNLPPVAALQIDSADSGIAPLMVLFNAENSSDPNGEQLSYLWDFGDGSTPVTTTKTTIAHEFVSSGSYTVVVTVTDSKGLSDSAQVSVVATDPVLPPDPETVAPPLPTTRVSSLSDQVSFLYQGANPIQTNVQPNAIEEDLIATVHGMVKDESGASLSGVIVKILEQDEVGQTLTRGDGEYDLALNGGGQFTVRFERNGYFSAQRKVDIKNGASFKLEDVILLRPDAAVTEVSVQSTQPQVHEASTVQDNDGQRSPKIIFPSDFTAQVELENGTMVNLDSLNVRMTEYTVGDEGLSRMPASLPPGSVYTYAVELSVDEALALNGKSVQFSKPYTYYVDNFMDIPVGSLMPVATYNETKGFWEADADGIVFSILSEAGGVASVDILGSGVAADQATLDLWGFTQEELTQIAQLYDPGKELWRVRLDHFSPNDINLTPGPVSRPTGPGNPGGGEPEGGEPTGPDPENPGPNVCPLEGCEIDPVRRTVKESISLPGVPFSLNYASEKQEGFTASNTYEIDLFFDQVSPEVTGVEVKTHVAGRSFTQTFAPSPDLKYQFTEWDGRDSFGRMTTTQQDALIEISYIKSKTVNIVPTSIVTQPGFSSWNRPVEGTPVAVTRGQEFNSDKFTFEMKLGPQTASKAQGIGGWTLSNHHFYDPESETLFMGSGEVIPSSDVGSFVTTFAGTGVAGSFTGGQPATEVPLNSPRGLAVDQKGNTYVVDGCCRIRIIDRQGVIRHFAGAGAAGFSGDGGPATAAQFNGIGRPGVTPDGALVFADFNNHVIRKIDSDGIVSTIAGTPGVTGPMASDGSDPLQVALNSPQGVMVSRTGETYFADSGNHVLYKIDVAGKLYRIAGNGVDGFSGDGGLARDASLSDPAFSVEDADGSIYISDRNNHIIRKITKAGIISTFMGTPQVSGSLQSAAARLNFSLNIPNDLVINGRGEFYIVDRGNNKVLKHKRLRLVRNEIGGGTNTFINRKVVGSRVELNGPGNIVWNPYDDSILISDRNNFVVRKYQRAWTQNTTSYDIPSPDGTKIYRFSFSGRHISTRLALTNQTIFQFGYDSNGRLISVTDGYGAVSTIVRDGLGNATSVTGPDGHISLISTSNGYLSSVTLPEGETTEMNYSPEGLLTSFKKPEGQENVLAYDSFGRLTSDQKPGGGSWLVNVVDGVVNFVDSLGREWSFNSFTNIQGDGVIAGQTPSGTQVASIDVNETRELIADEDGSSLKTFNRFDPLTGSGQFRGITRIDGYPVPSYDVTEVRTRQSLGGGDFLYSIESNGFTFQSTSTFDSTTSTWTTVTGEGQQQITEIDGFSNPVMSQFGGFTPVEYFYDSRGRIIQARQGNRDTFFAYNVRGELASVTDALGQITEYEYDLSGRRAVARLADTREIRSAYDLNSNLVSLVLPSGEEHEFLFGIFDLMESYLAPNVSGNTGQVQYSFNSEGEMISMARADGKILQYARDVAGRVILMSDGTSSLGVTYDSSNRIDSLTSSDGVAITKAYVGPVVTQRQYNGLFNATIDLGFYSNSLYSFVNLNGQSIPYSYDLDERLQAVGPMNISRDTLSGLITGLTLENSATTMSYSGFAELDQLEFSTNGNSVFSQNFSRDKLGRIIEKTETILGSTNTYGYSYDLTGRLSAVELNSAPYSSYSYDQNDNRTISSINGSIKTAIYDSQDRIQTFGNLSYQFNGHGDLISKTNTVSSATTNFEYDVFGQLKKVTFPSGNIIEYSTDGEQKRVARFLNGALTRSFVYSEQGQLIAELTPTGGIRSRFVYASQVHSPDFLIRSGVRYKMVKDHLGSIRLVVNTSTGTVAQQIDYDEWGVVLADTNPGFQPFGFAGGLYDSSTGLVRFGARDYDAQIGRWTAKDPIRFDGGTNLYSYAENDPVNLVDPSGKQAQNPCSQKEFNILESDLRTARDMVDRLELDAGLIVEAIDKAKREGKPEAVCPRTKESKTIEQLEKELREISNLYDINQKNVNDIQGRLDTLRRTCSSPQNPA